MRLISFIILFLSIISCSGVPEESVLLSNKSSAIVNGWKANIKDYPNTVALTRPDGKVFCTGTLIEKDLVITAAHCVTKYSHEYVKIAINSNEPELEPSKLFDIMGIRINPDYMPVHCNEDEGKCPITNDTSWNDIAIVVLKSEVNTMSCMPILTVENFNHVLYKEANVRIVGYGQNWIEDSGVLYAGNAPVKRITNYEIEIGNDKSGETNACFGDSGGPVFVTLDNVVYVTGVTSRSAFLPECEHGVIYSLPGAYSNWIYDSYHELLCEKYSSCVTSTYVDSCFMHPKLPVNKNDSTPNSDDGGCTFAIHKFNDSTNYMFMIVLGFVFWYRVQKNELFID